MGVRGQDGTVLVLDAGTGIRGLGKTIDASVRRIDILLTHLHMDHIQGLGFFAPLYRHDVEVGIWGPVSGKVKFAGTAHAIPVTPAVPGEPARIAVRHHAPRGSVRRIRNWRISCVIRACMSPGADGGIPHYRCAGRRIDVPAGP